MAKLLIELEWDDEELSDGWMNIDNLKSCLYGKTHINEGLCTVRVIEEELNAREALFAFCAWLTTRKERTVMGADSECGKIAYLVEEFSNLNELEETRPGWDNHFKMPKSK